MSESPCKMTGSSSSHHNGMSAPLSRFFENDRTRHAKADNIGRLVLQCRGIRHKKPEPFKRVSTRHRALE